MNNTQLIISIRCHHCGVYDDRISDLSGDPCYTICKHCQKGCYYLNERWSSAKTAIPAQSNPLNDVFEFVDRACKSLIDLANKLEL